MPRRLGASQRIPVLAGMTLFLGVALCALTICAASTRLLNSLLKIISIMLRDSQRLHEQDRYKILRRCSPTSCGRQLRA